MCTCQFGSIANQDQFSIVFNCHSFVQSPMLFNLYREKGANIIIHLHQTTKYFKCKLSAITISSFFLYCRPPTFKQVTPTCRTNVRQLLQREQSLQQEQRNRPILSSTSQDGSHLPKKRQNQAMSKNSAYSDTETYFKVTIIDYIIEQFVLYTIYYHHSYL